MGNKWERRKLGDVIELKRGYDLPSQSREPGNVPLVSSSGITDFLSHAMVKGPGVVTGRYGTLGKVFFVKDDFWPLNTTLFVADYKGNDPLFISYFLRSLDFSAYSDKAAVPGLNRNHLHQADVLFPKDVKVQRAIASILGSLDDKIELNRKTCATLEEMARILFKSWFVDFDPVRAKAAGERPASICKRLGLTREILDLFPKKLVDSELGEIPEGWEVVPLGELIELAYGKALTKDSRNEGTIPVYGSGGITGYNATALVTGPGIVVGRKGSIGTVYWIQGAFFPIDTVFFVRLLASIPLRWIFEILRSANIPEMGSDSAVPGVNRNVIYAQLVIRPNQAMLACYDNLVQPFVRQSTLLNEQTKSLKITRDALLPKLISGEIELPAGAGS